MRHNRNMKPVLVGLVGVKRSGKSTVAKILQTKYKFANLAFADPLKRMLLAAFPLLITVDMLWGDNKDDLYLSLFNDVKRLTLRNVLQMLGTDFFRDQVNRQIWVQYTLHEAEQLMTKGGLYQPTQGYQKMSTHFAAAMGNETRSVVVSDCRFLNEAQAIKDKGGIIIKINRDTALVDSHISENEMKEIPFDYQIDNNGSLKDLNESVEQVVNVMLSRM